MQDTTSTIVARIAVPKALDLTREKAIFIKNPRDLEVEFEDLLHNISHLEFLQDQVVNGPF